MTHKRSIPLPPPGDIWDSILLFSALAGLAYSALHVAKAPDRGRAPESDAIPSCLGPSSFQLRYILAGQKKEEEED